MKKVKSIYFSPTGTTQRISEQIGESISLRLSALLGLSIEWESFGFTSPKIRISSMTPKRFNFSSTEIVILALPVYAGRLPNLLLPFLQSLKGNGAIGIPIVVYGNRNFDDALLELKEIMEGSSFRVLAAGAFVGRHSFSDKIAPERPDTTDLAQAKRFAEAVSIKLAQIKNEQHVWKKEIIIKSPLKIPGLVASERVYYQPKNAIGERIDIRKMKPQTSVRCIKCARCVTACPMGVIEKANPRNIVGICIKCCACVRVCPVQAKYFSDEGFLYHVQELEQTLIERKEPMFFL